jgi:hypothetical protein
MQYRQNSPCGQDSIDTVLFGLKSISFFYIIPVTEIMVNTLLGHSGFSYDLLFTPGWYCHDLPATIVKLIVDALSP